MAMVHDPFSRARSASPTGASSGVGAQAVGHGKAAMVRARYGTVAGTAHHAASAPASAEPAPGGPVAVGPAADDSASHPLSRSAAPPLPRSAASRLRPRPSAHVAARNPLTRETLPERAAAQDSPRLSAALQRLWDDGVRESREAAARHRALAALWTEPVEGPEGEDPADLVELQVACALRTTRGRAHGLVQDAHRAHGLVQDAHRTLELFPRTFALLETGTLPAEWFARLLRQSWGLGPEASGRLDERVSRWDMGITAERFRRELSRAVSWLRTEQEEPALRPEEQRRVETFARPDGTASLIVTGPVPEILSLSRRLDDAARALRTAQRAALADGMPTPFDDGTVAETGRAMLLKDLRYAILTRSVLETGGIEVPAERYRLNVIVPALTLLGHSDVPGTIEGIAPIPAEMARGLAAGVDGWERVLTDPTTGAFLPLPAQRYRPTPAMREHLRLRGAQCAVPGCVRAVAWASETDHIEEYDHRAPSRGGRTEIENLHHLCPAHHAMKTAGRIDPVRRPGRIEVVADTRGDELEAPAVCFPDPAHDLDPAHGPEADPPTRSGHVSRPHTVVHPGSTIWSLGPDATVTVPDDTDLATPEMARRFLRLWAAYQQAERERQIELERQAVRDHEAGDAPVHWWSAGPTF